ncbi:uncharacterized protein LOC117831716 [Notolabrus celidotus]|uniref:uncharacterized protein LOC117831716 n=1 Tax=Notolabrus celidotus TaxID=1203425 RepID=UPI00148FA17A|nr:uncharacterized protein LOC117831716 [Notolabrus celidotus]XP_034566413.1 uncharacterized protein LOC117831716 [Notolabrus celidotus]
MSTADQLLEQMYSWIDQREQCAEKLKKLARELESLRKKCNASECVGSSVAVVGSACLIGAGVATLLTGGAAAPFLGLLGGAYTGVGVGISVITKITEHLSSSSTMKDAEKIERKSSEITKNIQDLFEQLKTETQLKKEMQLKTETQGRSYSVDPNDLDQEVTNEILIAIARRSGLQLHNVHMFKQPFFFNEGDMLHNPSFSHLSITVGLVGVLAFFTLKPKGKKFELLFVKGGQQLAKEVSKTGLKTALKGGAMVAGGVIGLAFALPEAIDQWKEAVKNNHVTEASQSLRDTADDLQRISRTLRKQLDEIQQTFRDFEELKCCIENSDRSSKQKENFIKTVKKYCDNQVILGWLNKVYDTEVFFKLVDLFYLLKQELDKKKKKTDREEIDIIFVAHGSIEEPLMSASSLLPLSTIEDVVLYSPWNCAIDSCSAYGIATGNLEPEQRVFLCTNNKCPTPHDGHRPTKLPHCWNSMKNAGARMIPNILVSPLRKPEDKAWKGFLFLQGKYGEPGRNRVVIPYMLPRVFGYSMTFPLYVVTLALSLVLFIFPFKATFHLAACLGRSSPTTLSEQGESLNQQYSCTIDDTAMTCPEGMFYEHPELYRALRAVFDR